MAEDKEIDSTSEAEEEDYEILPHKEITELKDELKKLKSFEVTPTKKLEVSIIELNKKLDRLLSVFDEAMHEVHVEEGGLTFEERMRPLAEKMNKILDQNSEIAEGIVALADLVKGKEPISMEEERVPPISIEPTQRTPPIQLGRPMLPPRPLPRPGQRPPMPPPPPRRKGLM